MHALNNDADLRDKFLFTLQWLLAVMARQDDADPQFYLARLSFGTYASMGETFGAADAVERLIAVEATLRQSFRKTDLIVRDGVDLWILTPYLSTIEKLQEKFMAVELVATGLGLDVVDRAVEVFTLPNFDLDDHEHGTAAELLAHLSAEHERLAMMKIHLPHN